MALTTTFGTALLLGALGSAPTDNPCRGGISPETTTRLYNLLNAPNARAVCSFEGVATNGNRLEATWSKGGVALPPVRIVTRQCADHPPPGTSDLVIDVPPELARQCPEIVPAVAQLASAADEESSVQGAGNRPLFLATIALLLAVGMLSIIRLTALAKRIDWRRTLAGAAAFGAALAVRASVPFSLGNWYSEVLPAAGPPGWMRFGPGLYSFEAILRGLSLWGPRALVWSQLIVGSAAVPLFIAVLRSLRVAAWANAAATMFLIFAPFHVRLSATPSEHVLASTLGLAFLLAWLDANRSGNRTSIALSVLLFAATCLTRGDMVVQASLLALWPLIVDREEGIRPNSRAMKVFGFGAAISLAVTYFFVIVESRNPGPEWMGIVQGGVGALPQYFGMATASPSWFSLGALLLVPPGCLWLGIRRPVQLLAILLTIILSFAGVGRLMAGDGLLSARYFLLTIPIFLILSGLGFEAVLQLVPAQIRNPAAAIALVALAGWTWSAARPAYAMTYAFQDEYAFARSALKQLPAGCTVYELPVRSTEFPRDVDCCLDVPRSPLVLEFPALRLRDLPRSMTSPPDSGGCVAYYETIACDVRDDGENLSRTRAAVDYFRTRCSEVRRIGRLTPVAETTTSTNTTHRWFADRPHVGLYRWTP